jgi:hypothetical protein
LINACDCTWVKNPTSIDPLTVPSPHLAFHQEIRDAIAARGRPQLVVALGGNT